MPAAHRWPGGGGQPCCASGLISTSGRGVVHRIITDLAVLHVTPDGFLLREVAAGVTVDQVRATTGAELTVAHDLVSMSQVA